MNTDTNIAPQPDTPMPAGSAEEAIWKDFCDQLKAAGQVLLREDLGASAFDRAEGLRYLARLTRSGLDNFPELTGPKHPVFRGQPDLVKMGLDNPDNYYVGAAIKAKHDYRIWGNRGNIHFLGFSALAQNFSRRDRITGGSGYLNDADMDIDADGGFELIASQRPHSGNWLRLAEDSSQIMARQTFLHRDRERPAQLNIECLQADAPPAALDPARIASQLQHAAMHAAGCAQWFADWVADMGQRAPLNGFYLPSEERHLAVSGDPQVRIYLGHWRLDPEQALIITLHPPACDYWNFQLANIWAESLDYRFGQVHLNNAQAQARADGSVRLVVAATDPGCPNWISTQHHDHGIMGVRWVRANSHPEPVCETVALAEVAERLRR